MIHLSNSCPRIPSQVHKLNKEGLFLPNLPTDFSPTLVPWRRGSCRPWEGWWARWRRPCRRPPAPPAAPARRYTCSSPEMEFLNSIYSQDSSFVWFSTLSFLVSRIFFVRIFIIFFKIRQYKGLWIAWSKRLDPFVKTDVQEFHLKLYTVQRK